MSDWWQQCHGSRDHTAANPTPPSEEVAAPYSQTFTTYPDCYGMSSPPIQSEYQHDSHYIDMVTPPTSAAPSQNVPFPSSMPLSYNPSGVPALPQSPQSVYSDTSYQTLEQQIMSSPYLPHMPPQQVFYLQRGHSLKEASTRRMSAKYATKTSSEIRHSWPMMPMDMTVDPLTGFPMQIGPNVDNQSSTAINLESHSDSIRYDPSAYQHQFSTASPELSRTTYPSQHLSPPQTHKHLSIPSALRPGPKPKPSQSHPQAQPRSQAESSNTQAPGSKHACPISTCHCTYKRKFELDRHLQEKHGPNSGRLLCPGDMCPRGIPGEGFDRMAHLVNHLTSGKHNWTKEQAVYAARRFNPKKGGAGARHSETKMERIA